MAYIYGNGYNNYLYGTIYNDYIYGYGGNDHLYGYSGNDYLDGGTGYDIMYGGTGNDTFVVDNVYDRVYEYSGQSQGIDKVYSYIYSYTLPTDVENLTLLGSAYRGIGTNFGNTIIGNNYNNALYGYGGNDYLYGLGGNDYLDGGTGNDYLDGGTGYDTMYGGTGNDTFVVDNVYDRVYEYSGSSQGIDTVQSYISYTLPTYVENLTLLGTAYGGYGTSFNNTITGNNSSNALYGYGGSDKLIGSGGSDTLQGSSSTSYNSGEYDILTGGSGYDTFVVGTSTSGNFYQGSGYVTITDYNGAYDWIQVKGTANDFYLDKSYNISGSSALDTILYNNSGEGLAVIQDNTNIFLTSYYFKFV